MEKYIIGNSERVVVTPLFVGWEECERGHSFGPYVRDCYLIHFCLKGRGILMNSEGIHEIEGGEFFVIRPGEVTTYTADNSDPWEYAWIAFNIESEKYFKGRQSVFETQNGLDEKLLHFVKSENKSPEGALAIIYELLHITSDYAPNDDEGSVARRVKRYVKYNYMLPITVNEIARTFGFERSYLYRIFKERYGTSIKEYITSVRLEMGAKLLADGYSVGESARMSGYEDRFNFSKAYKARFGKSPSDTAKSN